MSDTPDRRHRDEIVADLVSERKRTYDLERENAALRTDNRKLALHTAEQAKELWKLREQLEEAQDKALRFDIDSIGIERREAEGAELVTLRAELSAAQARIAELEKAVVRAMEATAFSSHEDTVGYRVCCDVRSYEPHKKDCYLRAALGKEKP